MSRGIIKTLNKNRIACLITAGLMLTAFVIGGARPLRKLRAETEAVFFSGAEQIAGRDIAVNIMGDLRDYHGKANNIAIIAERYHDGANDGIAGLQNARAELIQAVNEEKFNAARLYAAYDGLRAAVQSLEQQVSRNSAVSQSDNLEFRGVISELNALDTIISRQSRIFNADATEFNARLDRFPAVFFAGTGLVKHIDLFYN